MNGRSIVKKSSLCRTCGHQRKDHFIWIALHDGANEYADLMFPVETVPCNISQIGLPHVCGCKEWSPLDNLEYLSLKYMKNEESHHENS